MIRHPAEMKVELREKMRGGTGVTTIQHYFSADDFKAGVRLCARLTLPPGTSIGPHRHETEDEVYLVVSGSGIISDDHGQTRVKAGDAVLTGRGESHAVLNDTDQPLEIIAFIALYNQA